MTFDDPKSSGAGRFVERLTLAVRMILRPSRGGVRRMTRRSIAIVGIVFLSVFFLALLLFDVRIVTAARELPPRFIAFTRHFTDLGKAEIFLYPLPVLMIALCLVPAGLSRPVRGVLAALFARVAFLFLAIGIPYAINSALKQIFGRARPFVRDNVYTYDPFTWGSAYASLPSGHATTACAAAVAIGALFPAARIAAWIYAILIVISRVVVTAHHPSDVLAGALVGTMGALMVRNYFASRRIVFGVKPDGRVVGFAGPSWTRFKAAARAVFARA
jgi:undecaprenyl-diphosphatase